MLKTMGGVAAGWMLTSLPSVAETTAAGVKYEVIKKGDGPKPEIGELIAIRFNAFAGSNKIDDVFDTPEPYYTRLGSGGLLKGVESTLPMMIVGDRWKLTIPVSNRTDLVL
jgi:FKBP-type peptidyl-prolyl cis-trans isomerase